MGGETLGLGEGARPGAPGARVAAAQRLRERPRSRASRAGGFHAQHRLRLPGGRTQRRNPRAEAPAQPAARRQRAAERSNPHSRRRASRARRGNQSAQTEAPAGRRRTELTTLLMPRSDAARRGRFRGRRAPRSTHRDPAGLDSAMATVARTQKGFSTPRGSKLLEGGCVGHTRGLAPGGVTARGPCCPCCGAAWGSPRRICCATTSRSRWPGASAAHAAHAARPGGPRPARVAAVEALPCRAWRRIGLGAGRGILVCAKPCG